MVKKSKNMDLISGTKIHSSKEAKEFWRGIKNFYENDALRLKAFAPKESDLKTKSVPLKNQRTGLATRYLEKLILKRQTGYPLKKNVVHFSELSTVLKLAMGLKISSQWKEFGLDPRLVGKRAFPAAGGIYAIEAYIIARNIGGLDPGVYRFSATQMGLQKIAGKVSENRLRQCWSQYELFKEAACLIILTGEPNKKIIKYGQRGVRFLVMEAGGIGFVMNLVATSIGLKFCFDGGGVDSKFESLIGVDGKQECLLTRIVISR